MHRIPPFASTVISTLTSIFTSTTSAVTSTTSTLASTGASTASPFRSIVSSISSIGGLVALTMVLGSPTAARAQISPFTFELRGGAALPVEELADAEGSWAGDVEPGPSFGMDFAYAFRHYVAAYAGFSQHRFGCRVTSCGRERDLVATGFDLGLRFILGSGRVSPLIRTGLVTYKATGSVPEPGGPARAVTSHRSVGGEAGVGLTLRLTPSVVLVPGARYLRMTGDFGPDGTLPIRTTIVDLGLMLAF